MSGFPANNRPVGKIIAGTSYTIGAIDEDQCLVFTSNSAIAVTLPAPGVAGMYGNWRCEIFAAGAGNITVTPIQSPVPMPPPLPTINGSSSLTVDSGGSAQLFISNDSNWQGASGGGAAPGTLTAVINAENWTADVSFAAFKAGGSLTLNPITTPTLTFNVASPGFDSSGNPATFNRTVVGTIAKRQPWPNQTDRVETANSAGTTITIALSDQILSTDVV